MFPELKTILYLTIMCFLFGVICQYIYESIRDRLKSRKQNQPCTDSTQKLYPIHLINREVYYIGETLDFDELARFVAANYDDVDCIRLTPEQKFQLYRDYLHLGKPFLNKPVKEYRTWKHS